MRCLTGMHRGVVLEEGGSHVFAELRGEPTQFIVHREGKRISLRFIPLIEPVH